MKPVFRLLFAALLGLTASSHVIQGFIDSRPTSLSYFRQTCPRP